MHLKHEEDITYVPLFVLTAKIHSFLYSSNTHAFASEETGYAIYHEAEEQPN